MKHDIKNLQASIRAQLQNKAKETNRPFSEILQYYGMERFLYRFSRSNGIGGPIDGESLLKDILTKTLMDSSLFLNVTIKDSHL